MATSSPSVSKQWLRGLFFVLMATLCLSLQNVLVKIAQSKTPFKIFSGLFPDGLFKLGGYVTPEILDPSNPLQVPLLILLIRISFVVPFLWMILPIVHEGAFSEARQVISGKDNSLKLRIVAAGSFLFLSQMGIYLAIPLVGPGTAVTLFFIYPTVTTLLAWRLFGERPSLKQWLAIILIYMGCIWLTFPFLECVAPQLFENAVCKPPVIKTEPFGILMALASGVVFAVEGILAQSCFGKISPPTFTGLVFTVEWVVLAIAAAFLVKFQVNSGLLLMGLLLCMATMSGYLFNNFGIKTIGAASTSIIGSSGPAVTSLLSLLILQDVLKIEQWVAIAVVTIGVILMNLAKFQTKSTLPNPIGTEK
ncbi:EamA family transporter [Tumidithrix elongata RA019]|uniref:EamA family transporter n=1 Tax=Tumidithrix elongata BACA0141 TaxID=2716417 RepID=A0AAW9PWN2_9CYAN|nr:EamA family transporter [Tumidithrix elongata RA019]